MINNNGLLVLRGAVQTREDRLNVVSGMLLQVEEESEEELGRLDPALECPVNNVTQNGRQDLGKVSVDKHSATEPWPR